jgi:ATP-dependent Lon protease
MASVLGRIVTTGRPPAEMRWIAVRDDVVFPDALTDLAVGRSASIAAVGADAGDGWLAVFAQRDSAVDDPGPADVYTIGCATRIISVEPLDGSPGVNVRLHPVTRVEAVGWIDAEGGGPPRVRVKAMPESNAPLDALQREAVEALCIVAVRHALGWSKTETERYVRSVATSSRLVWLGAAYLALDVAALQALLESDDVHANVERILTCRDELGLGEPPRSWWQRLWRAVFG